MTPIRERFWAPAGLLRGEFDVRDCLAMASNDVLLNHLLSGVRRGLESADEIIGSRHLALRVHVGFPIIGTQLATVDRSLGGVFDTDTD